MKRALKRTISLFLLLLICFGVSVSAAKAKTPGKVTSLKVTSKDNSITLKWNKASNAKGYTVYLIDNTTGIEKKYRSTTKTSLTITKCTYNKKYTFKVGAYGKNSVKGELSNAVSVTPTPTQPTVPKNFSLSTLGDKNAVLKWSRSSNCSGYIIESYDASTKTYQTLKTINSRTTNKATIYHLTGDKEYTLRIRSYRKVGSEIIYSGSSNTITFKAKEFNSAIKAVRGPRYRVTLKKTITAKTSSGIVTLAKGTSLTVSSKSASKVTAYLSNGKTVLISRSALSYKGLDSSPANDYSTAVKEQFVNSKLYKSSTNYLIWISQYKLKVNVFQGSRGNWKLVKTFPCVVGKWSTRTPGGIHKIVGRGYGYGGPVLYFTVGTVNGGTPFNPKGAAFHNQIDSTISKAVSGGCCRLRLGDLNWLAANCKIGTTVVSY